jgi:hypothetical protein
MRVPRLPSRSLSRLLLRCLVAAAAAQGWATAHAAIYTCVDAKGRKLTSDRPIPDCLDREQKELGPNGTVRRTLGPSLTAAERAAQEERERKLAEERQRQADENRAQKALLNRYPNQAAHDLERGKALLAAQSVIAAGQRRLADLQEQRKRLNEETEFYRDPAKWPPKLKRQIEELEQQTAAQQRFLSAQEGEKKRINTRFDEELVRLKLLWAQARPGATTTAAGGAAAPGTTPPR